MAEREPSEMGRDAVITRGIVTDNPEALLRGSGTRAVWGVLREAGLRLLSDYDKQLKAGEEPTLSRANFDDLDLDPKAWPN